MRIDVQWASGESLQARIVLAPCTAADYVDVMGADPPRRAEEKGELWYCATPDGDVYPHCLSSPPLRLIVPYDQTGRRLVARRVGRAAVPPGPIYGDAWSPSPQEFCQLLELALGKSLPDVLGRVTGTSTSDAEEDDGTEEVADAAGARRASRGRGAAGRGEATSASGTPLPSEWVLERSTLPAGKWTVLATSDGAGTGPLTDLGVDCAVMVAGMGLGVRDSRHFLFANSQTSGGEALDARVLSIRESPSEGRHLQFRDAVGELSTTDWAKFPISGPRTTEWVCRFIRDQDIAPRSRHVKWRAEVRLDPSDQSVLEHEFCSRVLQLAVQYDQLNVSELACMELICRKLQMAEYRHRERVLGLANGDELLEDQHLYMGTGETRGMLMIAPALLSHVTEELHKEAAVLKERRKLREERASSRATGSGGGPSKPAAAALQSTVDKQKAEIAKLRAEIAGDGAQGSGPKGGGRGGGK